MPLKVLPKNCHINEPANFFKGQSKHTKWLFNNYISLPIEIYHVYKWTINKIHLLGNHSFPHWNTEFSKFFWPKKNRAGVPLREMIYSLSSLLYFIQKRVYFTKQKIRSILTQLTYLDRNHSQELPNQLVLQTGHRNAEAKKPAPWILHATQRLQSDLLLEHANLTCPVPTWHGAPAQVNQWAKMVRLNSPPQKFTRQVKSFRTQDPGTTQPEGNFTHLTMLRWCIRFAMKITYSFGCINKDDCSVTYSKRCCHFIREIDLTYLLQWRNTYTYFTLYQIAILIFRL